ncbi:hypothetical protein HYPDE_36673 [Hyphomicrobium denitrificans 1NES1]|uniref:Uncharacterized protein n=1 Tax=Hyphomicrobium denitrificans 1NES1 TaxID=670307 RepID=N0BF20_9HYPH|nr:hypothetical protein HYPDE_36673 [Hyphomicrobium denitrificans 1NES1]
MLLVVVNSFGPPVAEVMAILEGFEYQLARRNDEARDVVIRDVLRSKTAVKMCFPQEGPAMCVRCSPS